MPLSPVQLFSVPSLLPIVWSGGANVPTGTIPPFIIIISPRSELVSLKNEVASVVGEYVMFVVGLVCDCHSFDDGRDPFSEECRFATAAEDVFVDFPGDVTSTATNE